MEKSQKLSNIVHRTGLIEKWGHGTNKVIAMCREAGISPPEFEEITGAAVVTFRVSVGTTGEVTVEVTGKSGGFLPGRVKRHQRGTESRKWEWGNRVFATILQPVTPPRYRSECPVKPM
ncbi:MAG: hypothetical protein HY036_02135 [Nitrospirae bacterium]|nr:hypothetical protein [Nitrospirota bacterium]MBI3351356.1 hypothetical protein [Nitrospirota bacterium]